jgi:hypothetical protein
LSLDAGSGFGANLDFVLASGAGTSPGLVLDGVRFPLNVDAILNLSLTSATGPAFVNTLGALDANGQASATLQVPPGTVLLLSTLHFASLFPQPTPLIVSGASNAVPIEWLP